MANIRIAFFGLLAALLATNALADVKSGVDAWSRGDYPAAVKEWRQPAIDGDADAQFNMGQAYKLGRGVPLDLKMAEDWFRKAAMQGHPKGEDNYGLILFQNGERLKALPILQKSAGRGEPRAQYLLATAYFNGDLVKTDWPRAYALMTRASAAGLAPATASLAQMDRFIPLDQRQQGLALAREFEQTGTLAPAPAETEVAAPSTLAAAPAAKAPVGASARPPSRPVTAAATPPSLPRPRPGAARATGGWRIQLGAFGDQAKASAQWARLSGRVSALSGLQPSYEKAGAFVRLRAGPAGSKSGAEKLCAAARSGGSDCFPVAP